MEHEIDDQPTITPPSFEELEAQYAFEQEMEAKEAAHYTAELQREIDYDRTGYYSEDEWPEYQMHREHDAMLEGVGDDEYFERLAELEWFG